MGNKRANRVEPPLSERDKRKAVAYVKSEAGVSGKRRRGLRKLAPELDKHPHDIVISRSTLQRAVQDYGGKAKHPDRGPVYKLAQRRKRVRFSKDHLADDWSTTLASDEVEVCTDGSINAHNNYVYVFGENEHVPVQSRNKFPAVRKYFIGISKNGVLEPTEYKGNLNSDSYQRLLETALDGANELFGGHEWRFLHDGASYHTAASTQAHLETAVPSFFTRDEWPVAPDANPCESIFGEMQDRIAKAAPRNLAELDEVFRAAFTEATTPEKLQHLFDNASMQRRLLAIIDARGHKTKY